MTHFILHMSDMCELHTIDDGIEIFVIHPTVILLINLTLTLFCNVFNLLSFPDEFMQYIKLYTCNGIPAHHKFNIVL